MSAEFPMLDPIPDVPGLCDRRGAEMLKAKIEAYWAARGHSVMVTVHESAFHPAIRSTRFDVRSDMLNGMPRPPAIEDRRAA